MSTQNDKDIIKVTSRSSIFTPVKSISISIAFTLITIAIFTTSAFALNNLRGTTEKNAKENTVQIDTQATIHKLIPTVIGTGMRIER
ncbi:MAG: hypothetical protein WAU72_04260 [Acidimicrobiia bacterium]